MILYIILDWNLNMFFFLYADWNKKKTIISVFISEVRLLCDQSMQKQLQLPESSDLHICNNLFKHYWLFIIRFCLKL